jgi:2-keto-4-pentenoate hydratase/2-oxohepta-3-ene-1,7-dioic acid hydratase in catechol pathway
MHLVNFERIDSHVPAKSAGSLGDAALGFEALEPALPGSRRIGAVIQLGPYAGTVVDLNRMLAIKLAYDDVGAPEVEANSLVPPDLFSFLGLGASALEAAQIALDFAIATLDRYDAPDLLRAGAVYPETRVKICAPLPRPGKIIGVASNYPDRGAASPDADESDVPALFLRAPSAVIGPHDEICLPASAHQVDFQGELAVAIGTRAKNISETDALGCVAGYCVAVDVTARDLERGRYGIGKSCDTFAPLGPALVTADEIPDPQALGIRSTLSGDVLQVSSTGEMRFPVANIIAFASTMMTLEPGDVILAGAPSAAETSHGSPRSLRDGDIVEVEIGSLGRLRNYVTKAKAR